MTNLADYIRQAAISRGIDPEIALRVAGGEGGLNNPFRHGEGPAPKSQDPRFGAHENSFGPFQLYVSGRGAGLGDRAVAAGIDPRKNWQGGVDFALDEAKRAGWGQWYGAKAAGITGMMGIGGGVAPTTVSSAPNNNPGPNAAMLSPGVNNAPQAFGDMIAPPVAPATPNLGQIAANYLQRRKVQAETEAADQARRQALFGGGLGDLYG